MSLIITLCTKRKRTAVSAGLQARGLPSGEAATVAATWAQRLADAPAVTAGRDLYAGRGFLEARRAAEHLGARLAIVSAGLGLIDGDDFVPAYSLTMAPGDPDSILSRASGDAAGWWQAVQTTSPFARDIEALAGDGLILAALSAPYAQMVGEAWSGWPEGLRARLRLFSKEAPRGAAAALRDAWMPYDDRLDAVAADHAGTQGDFAQRALRHFTTTITPAGSARADAGSVEAALSGLQARATPVRRRLDDAALMAVIQEHWAAVDGRSGAMLRHLRDALGVACEQGRFQALFARAATQRLEAGG